MNLHVRMHEVGRHLHGAHPQAEQVIETHMGAGGPEAERAQAGTRVGKERRGRKRSSAGGPTCASKSHVLKGVQQVRHRPTL